MNGPAQTPEWEFNGESLVYFGGDLTPKGRENALVILNSHMAMLSALKMVWGHAQAGKCCNDPKHDTEMQAAIRAAIAKAEAPHD